MKKIYFLLCLLIPAFLTTYSQTTIFSDDFDPAPTAGWTTGTVSGTLSWATGDPQGGNGSTASGTADPTSDNTSTNTDNNVYGQGLSATDGDGLGGYNSSTEEWLKTPSFDCSNYTSVSLSFYRWANFESSYDEAFVEISTDNSSWTDLAEPQYPQDASWTQVTIDISSYADGESTVYIRWRMTSDGSVTYAGWNIDDVEVTGTSTSGPTAVFEDDFETDKGWTLDDDTNHEWFRGTAENNGGSNSMYVSNNNGTSAAYTITTTPATIWAESPTIDLSSYTGSTLKFDWKGYGESGYDYGEVYVDNGSDNLVSAAEEYALQSTWNAESIDISAYDGQSITVKFKWIHDGSVGTNPPLCIDNFIVEGTSSADSDSDVDAPTTQVASTTINSTSTTSGTAVDVFKFKIKDLGTADGEATSVTNIRVKTGASNTADWTDHIQGVKLNDGAAVTIGSPTITDSYIDIPITSGNLDVADNTNKEVTLSVYLNTTNISDNAVFQCQISNTGHGAQTGGGSTSSFASDFGTAITGNTHTIEVTATKLGFTTNKPTATVAINDRFEVEVKAFDANDNLDVDNTCSVTLVRGTTGTGTLSANGTPSLTQSLVGGVFGWTNVEYNTAETFNINASCGGLSGTSIDISCIQPPGAFDITAPLASSGCAGNINVTWNASSDASTYDLYWCADSACDPTSGTLITGVTSPYVFSASTQGTEYNFKVRANNAADFTLSSNTGTHNTFASDANTAVWTGTANTTWSNTANWCGGTVPSSIVDVVIPAGLSNYPTFTGTGNVRDLTIESGATVNLSSSILNVYGDYINAGTFNSGTGTIAFRGATTQTLDNGATGTFNNFTVNKTSGSVIITDNTLDVNGNLTITAGTLNANDQNIEVAGNWDNEEIFTAGAGTVIFDGSSNSTVDALSSGSDLEIFTDDFESGNNGWSMGSVASHTDWRICATGYGGSSYALATAEINGAVTEHSYYSSTNTANNTYVDVTREVDLTDYTTATLSYRFKCGGSVNFNYSGMVKANGVDILTTTDQQYSGYTSWTLQAPLNLNAYCGDKVQITFRMNLIYQSSLGAGVGFSVDDIEIVGKKNRETFNNVEFNKTGGAKVDINSNINVNSNLVIANGCELDLNANQMYCDGDFENNGTFTAATNSSVTFDGSTAQTISGSENISFYDLTKNTSSDLIIGDNTDETTITVSNDLIWTNNADKIEVGNGQKTTFVVEGDLYIKQGCTLETSDESVVSVGGNYIDYGTLTPNDGMIKMHGNNDASILREPALVIFSEDFESGTAGWTLGSYSTYTAWVRSTGLAHNSSYDCAVKDINVVVPYDYSWSPPLANQVDLSRTIDLSGYTVAELTFWWMCGGEPNYDYGQVLIDGVVIVDNMHSQPTYIQSDRIDLSAYLGGTHTLTFRFKSDGSDGSAPGLCIDDIFITSSSVNMETFNDLTIEKTAATGELWCPIDVDGDVLINSGDFKANSVNFPVGGNWTGVGASTFTHGNNVVTFDGTGAQAIINGASTSFNSVIINKAAGTATLSTNTLKLDGDMTLTSGTLSNGQNVEIKGSWLNNGGTLDPLTSMVTFNGTGLQTVTSNSAALNTFNDISIDKTTGIVEPADSITMEGDMSLIEGTLDASSNNTNIRLKGDWLVGDGSTTGVFFPGTGRVSFFGTSTQNINKTTGGAFNLNDFTFNDVVIDGTDVNLFLESGTYKVIMRDLKINNGKLITIDGDN